MKRDLNFQCFYTTNKVVNEVVFVVCYIADRQFYKPIKTGAVYPPGLPASLGLTICCFQFLIQYPVVRDFYR